MPTDRIERFNPHNMSDDSVAELATGREALAAEVLDAILTNAAADTPNRHILLTGPRGIGKSFFLRLVQVQLKRRRPSLPFVLLPEEQYHIRSPADLLDEIARVLRGEGATMTPPRFEERDEGWQRAQAELLQAISNQSGNGGRPFAVAAIENFDRLLDRVFESRAEQSALRRFLAEQGAVMLIASTLKGDLDSRYDDRLFYSFSHYRLQPWQDDDFRTYFRKRARNDADLLHEAKVRAVSQFTGGSPRMGVILADLAREGDPLSAAETLKALVDWLTPYYQNLLDGVIPPRSLSLFDALIRGGEPCSQSELARRLGKSQSAIAQAFSWLRESEIVFGERAVNGKATLYRVADRVFVYYYRQRLQLVDNSHSPLAALADFLIAFYEANEMMTHANRLFGAQKHDDASVLTTLSLFKSGYLDNPFGASLNSSVLEAIASVASVFSAQDPLSGLNKGEIRKHLETLTLCLKSENFFSRRREIAVVLLWISSCNFLLAQHREMLRAARAASRMFGRLGDYYNQIQALNRLIIAYNLLNRNEPSAKVAEQAARLAKTTNDKHLILMTLTTKLYVYAKSRPLKDSMALIDEITDTALDLDRRIDSGAIISDPIRAMINVVGLYEEENGVYSAMQVGMRVLRSLNVISNRRGHGYLLSSLFVQLLHSSVSSRLIRELVEEARTLCREAEAANIDCVLLAIDYLDSGRAEGVLQRADPEMARVARVLAESRPNLDRDAGSF